MRMRSTLLAVVVFASVAPAVTHACGYGPQPSITVQTPRAYSVNQTPFTISGTADGATCNGVTYDVTRVTVRFWATLGAAPTTMSASCTCPGDDVTWSLTVTQGMFFPGLYTIDADAYDAENRGGNQRLQFFIV